MHTTDPGFPCVLDAIAVLIFPNQVTNGECASGRTVIAKIICQDIGIRNCVGLLISTSSRGQAAFKYSTDRKVRCSYPHRILSRFHNEAIESRGICGCGLNNDAGAIKELNEYIRNSS